MGNVSITNNKKVFRVHLSQVSYVEFDSKPYKWWIDPVDFGKITLIVGRNATGKSRLISVISVVADLLCGRRSEVSFDGKFHLEFNDDGLSWVYDLEHDVDEVVVERLTHQGKVMVNRGRGGFGRMEAFDSDENTYRNMKMKIERKKVAIANKRDGAMYPYLEGINTWGESLRHFQFGTEMNAGRLAIAVKNVSLSIQLDEKTTDQFVPILDLALKQHKEAFRDMVVADMKTVGYDISDVSIAHPPNVLIHGVLPGELVGATVQEVGLNTVTNQLHMSTGMFRVFSLISQLNYYVLSGKSGCIIVDDIGDGLDFERTIALISLVRKKADTSNVQLIMSTNNRFIMNHVPFEEWCVLHRTGGHVVVKNYANSKDQFDEFRMTGLSNFDLFSSDYLFNTTEE